MTLDQLESCPLHDDVASLSFQLLLLARETIRRSPEEASLRFGLDKRQIEALRSAGLDELKTLADTGRMSFKPSFVIREDTRPRQLTA